jgi:ubiquitin-protein ligase
METAILNEQHNSILDRFKNFIFQRRLRRELTNMCTKYDHIELEVTNANEIRVNIYCADQNDKWNIYGFEITYDYPFRPPRIFYQNRRYIDFLKTAMNINRELFQKITGYTCFCCHSINCSDNWKPSLTLENIILEIQAIKRKRRDFINKLMADKIKRRYLIADIDLESWL